MSENEKQIHKILDTQAKLNVWSLRAMHDRLERAIGIKPRRAAFWLTAILIASLYLGSK